MPVIVGNPYLKGFSQRQHSDQKFQRLIYNGSIIAVFWIGVWAMLFLAGWHWQIDTLTAIGGLVFILIVLTAGIGAPLLLLPGLITFLCCFLIYDRLTYGRGERKPRNPVARLMLEIFIFTSPAWGYLAVYWMLPAPTQ